jgi:hypothetical protein
MKEIRRSATDSSINNLRFEVLTAVKMQMLVLWVVTPCGLVGKYQGFGAIYCVHPAMKMEAVCSSETFGIYLQVHMALLPRMPTSTISNFT